MLATIGDDTWNVLNMQRITPDSKRWDYSNISGTEKIKGTSHMVEGEHNFRKCPHPHPRPDSKVHGTNMGPIWGRQDPGGPMLAPCWPMLGALLLRPDAVASRLANASEAFIWNLIKKACNSARSQL